MRTCRPRGNLNLFAFCEILVVVIENDFSSHCRFSSYEHFHGYSLLRKPTSKHLIESHLSIDNNQRIVLSYRILCITLRTVCLSLQYFIVSCQWVLVFFFLIAQYWFVFAMNFRISSNLRRIKQNKTRKSFFFVSICERWNKRKWVEISKIITSKLNENSDSRTNERNQRSGRETEMAQQTKWNEAMVTMYWQMLDDVLQHRHGNLNVISS